jgi:hypothetical protein
LGNDELLNRSLGCTCKTHSIDLEPLAEGRQIKGLLVARVRPPVTTCCIEEPAQTIMPAGCRSIAKHRVAWINHLWEDHLRNHKAVGLIPTQKEDTSISMCSKAMVSTIYAVLLCLRESIAMTSEQQDQVDVTWNAHTFEHIGL